MAERQIPFRDFAAAQVRGKEGEGMPSEVSYGNLLDTGWSQLQEAANQGLSKEETEHLVHAHEDALTLYWLNQMTRDGFVQNQGRPNSWTLENDEEEVEIWFAGERGGAPYGYNAIHFTRRTANERAHARLHYQHDPAKGLLLYTTYVYEGSPENALLSHELIIRRGTPEEEMAQHTFIKRFPVSRVYAEMVWTEGNPSPDLDDLEDIAE